MLLVSFQGTGRLRRQFGPRFLIHIMYLTTAVTKFDKPIVTENLNDRVIIKVLKTNASLRLSMFLEGIICIGDVETIAGVILKSVLLVKDGTAQVLRSTRNFQAGSRGDN